jgi:uncharacterized protein YmfQ (DUF2313 family)
MDAAAYRDQLVALQPPGTALPTEPGATWTELLGALADELARVDARVGVLVAESDPRTTYELLDGWERATGLPDTCASSEAGMEERRFALLQRLTTPGGANASYFIALAEAMGYPAATVTEFPPFTCTSDCDDSLNPAPTWPHAWQLNLPAQRITDMTCGSACDASLRAWGDTALECVVARAKPAQTTVIFTYGD